MIKLVWLYRGCHTSQIPTSNLRSVPTWPRYQTLHSAPLAALFHHIKSFILLFPFCLLAFNSQAPSSNIHSAVQAAGCSTIYMHKIKQIVRPLLYEIIIQLCLIKVIIDKTMLTSYYTLHLSPFKPAFKITILNRSNVYLVYSFHMYGRQIFR